jgi:hypothetical protein
MSGLVYAIVLLGCSDGGDNCQPVTVAPVEFAQRETCMANIEPALASDTAMRADFPTIVAKCEARASRMRGAQLMQRGRKMMRQAR